MRGITRGVCPEASQRQLRALWLWSGARMLFPWIACPPLGSYRTVSTEMVGPATQARRSAVHVGTGCVALDPIRTMQWAWRSLAQQPPPSAVSATGFWRAREGGRQKQDSQNGPHGGKSVLGGWSLHLHYAYYLLYLTYQRPDNSHNILNIVCLLVITHWMLYMTS